QGIQNKQGLALLSLSFQSSISLQVFFKNLIPKLYMFDYICQYNYLLSITPAICNSIEKINILTSITFNHLI
ncbi:hypothetical protein, partial [Acinetobacter pseudolwoffii]|uniref:hypothetical protein n=1 Tax=Acinetobacter pseudolwoffii TaxID=2053287 RepID=UPI00257491FE